MPYIDKEDRDYWSSPLKNLLSYKQFDGPGELNYIFTKILQEYLHQKETSKRKKSYSNYNEILGVLECVKLEFYRRLVSQYEDEKIKQNGDVY